VADERPAFTHTKQRRGLIGPFTGRQLLFGFGAVIVAIVGLTIVTTPLGNTAGFQPYVGGGVGAYRWRYSETGQFVDFQNNVFTGNFVGSGGAVGPVILGGVRVPVGSAGVGFEIRYQSAEGDLPADQGFAGSTIDLGGMNYLFTLNFRF